MDSDGNPWTGAVGSSAVEDEIAEAANDVAVIRDSVVTVAVDIAVVLSGGGVNADI
jgi:hypothetical protein